MFLLTMLAVIFLVDLTMMLPEKSCVIILEEHRIIPEFFLILFATNYSKNYSSIMAEIDNLSTSLLCTFCNKYQRTDFRPMYTCLLNANLGSPTELCCRPEPIMLLKLPIMLLSNAPKISLLCSNYAQSCPIMP